LITNAFENLLYHSRQSVKFGFEESKINIFFEGSNAMVNPGVEFAGQNATGPNANVTAEVDLPALEIEFDARQILVEACRNPKIIIDAIRTNLFTGISP